jgi:hypothetical protein
MTRPEAAAVPVMLRLMALPLLMLATLSQSYIDLEIQIRGMEMPWVDLCALLLLGLGFSSLWMDAREGHGPPLPGIRGYSLFLVASVLSIGLAMEPEIALHHVLRKPLFFYLAYGVGVAWWISRGLSSRALTWMLLSWAASTALVSLAHSSGRILSGDGLWHQAVEGLSPNHKAITVALAGGLPLLMGLRLKRRLEVQLRTGILALAALAIIASASKTAILTGAMGLSFYWPRNQPLIRRPRLVLAGLGIGLLVAYYSPLFMQSNAMLDAARSRHSLNERALEMFASNPLLGAGSGMGPHYEQVTWPHYRVNGVDTHGVIQKIASETGLLGLAGYGLFMSSTGMVLLRRRRKESDAISQAALCTWATLHTNLLLSTEVLSPTHWLPFAVAWGMAHRIPIGHDANPDGPHLSPPTGRRLHL